jgi:hypothetical protein
MPTFDQVFLDQHHGKLKFKVLCTGTHEEMEAYLERIQKDSTAMSICVTARDTYVPYYHVAYVPK